MIAFWTDEEKETLRTHYVEEGTEAVRKLLPHRTASAIRRQAATLGLFRCVKWTADDNRKLKWMWATVPIASVARSLGRTELAVYHQAQLLGLRFGRQPGYETIRDASKRLGFSADTLVRILHECGRHLKASFTTIARETTYKRLTVNTKDADEAVAHWLSTENVGVAARSRGVCDVSLRGWLIAAGYNPTGQGREWRLPSETIDKVIDERAKYIAGKETVNAAAKRIGLAHSTLLLWLYQDGQRKPANYVKWWFVDPTIVDRIVEEKMRARCRTKKRTTPPPSSNPSSDAETPREISSRSRKPRSKRSVASATIETGNFSERKDSTAA